MGEAIEELPNKEKQTSKTTKDQPKTPKKSHKKRIIFISLATVFILFVLTPALVAGYFGFVPILSTIMGANQTKDLGVTYSQQDYINYLAKTKTDLQDFANAPNNPDNPNKKIVFADPIKAENIDITQEELTAAINESEWVWMPINNAQIRLSENNIEISGNLELDNIANFISFIGGVGYEQQDINTAVDWAKRLINNAPIYLKAQASVQDNQLNLTVEQVTVGRYTIPADIAQTVFSSGAQNAINRTPGFNAEQVIFKDGSIQFSGTHPTTIYVKTK